MKSKALVTISLVLMISSLSLLGCIEAKPVQQPQWQVERNGGTYSVSKGAINLSAPVGGGQYVILYQAYQPTGDFTVTLKVQASTLQGFAIMLRGSLPFAGSTDGVNFQFGSMYDGSFLLARWTNYWTWNTFAYGIQENTWYTMKLTVHESPYSITAEAYSQKGALLGTCTISDMTNLGFSDIQYVGFGVLESGGTYVVKNVAIA